MPISNPEAVVARLASFQREVRDLIIRSRSLSDPLHGVSRSSAADTIYRIDTEVDPLLEAFCERWAAEEGPIVLVAEGLEDASGREVQSRVFPHDGRDA